MVLANPTCVGYAIMLNESGQIPFHRSYLETHVCSSRMCQQHSTNCRSLAYLNITRVFKQNVSAALNQLLVPCLP